MVDQYRAVFDPPNAEEFRKRRNTKENNMKKFAVTLILVLTFSALAIQAQTCNKQTIEQLAQDFAKSYETKDLGGLDAQRPFLSSVKFSIENSLGEDGDKTQFVTKQFKNLGLAENWLKSREIDGVPSREIEPLISCKKGICNFNVVGLLHNQLFLKQLSFGYKKNGCPYIKTVFLIDGN